MKSLVAYLLLSVLVSLLVAGIVLVCALPSDETISAIIGTGVAALLACTALVFKSLSTPEPGPQGVQKSLVVGMVTLGVRAVAILVGGLACKNHGIEPTAYVLAFFGCALAQQAIEVKFLLSAQSPASPKGA